MWSSQLQGSTYEVCIQLQSSCKTQKSARIYHSRANTVPTLSTSRRALFKSALLSTICFNMLNSCINGMQKTTNILVNKKIPQAIQDSLSSWLLYVFFMRPVCVDLRWFLIENLSQPLPTYLAVEKCHVKYADLDVLVTTWTYRTWSDDSIHIVVGPFRQP